MTGVPTVSVVMPAYNAGRYISLAIKSILDQTYPDFELLIIEDESSDDTREIISKRAAKDARVVPVFNKTNMGLTRSLNKGIDLARGEFVARMDADDISHPDRFEKQLAYLRANPDVCLIATSVERIDEEGRTISARRMDAGKEGLKKLMQITCAVAHGSVMFRRKEVIALGKYREGIRYAEDYDLWLRMMERYEIDVLPDILYKFRLTHQSRSVAESAQDKYYCDLVRQYARERRMHGKDTYSELPDSGAVTETSSRKRDEMYHLYRGLEFLASDLQKDARRDFRQCIRLKPARLLYWVLLGAAVAPLPVLNVARWFWRKAPRDIH